MSSRVYISLPCVIHHLRQQGQFNINVKTSASISTNKAQRRCATICRKTSPGKRLFHFRPYLICFNKSVHRFYLLLTIVVKSRLARILFFLSRQKSFRKNKFLSSAYCEILTQIFPASASISTNKAQRRFATKRQKTLQCKRLFHDVYPKS